MSTGVEPKAAPASHGMFCTRYEEARLISMRAHQLADGATPLVDVSGTDDVAVVAAREFRAGVLPLVVLRYNVAGKVCEARAATDLRPNSISEDWYRATATATATD